MNEMYDLTIIGAGPVGMFAGFYAGLRELNTQFVEALPQVGGQVEALYPEKEILDIPAYPQVSGHNLINNLKEQLNEVNVQLKLGQTVTNVEKIATGFKVTTPTETTYSKTVLIALGNGAFTPRKLAIDNAEEFEGSQLFYHVDHVKDFENQRVLIAGGGDTAIDTALMLESVTKEVHLMHRRSEFRALEHNLTRLRKSSVQLQTPFLIDRMDQQSDGSLMISMKEVRGDKIKRVNVDKVIVSYGFTANNKALNDWTVNFETQRADLIVDQAMMTSVDGVYAIGDGVTYSGKAKLIATGFGEGPTAINAIVQKIKPNSRGIVHSTSLNLGDLKQ